MIHDGWNEQATVDTYAFLYRRLPYDEAIAIRRELLAITSDGLFCEAKVAVIRQQIVAMEWGLNFDDLDQDVHDQLERLVFGVGRYAEEKADEQNLHDGARLAALYPWLLQDLCGWCRTRWYDPITGRTSRTVDGEPRLRIAEPLCECDVCPKGHWRNPVQFTERNAAAFRFHQACEATGTFPDDPRVRRNAHIITAARKSAGEHQKPHGTAARGSARGPEPGHVADRAGAGGRGRRTAGAAV